MCLHLCCSSFESIEAKQELGQNQRFWSFVVTLGKIRKYRSWVIAVFAKVTRGSPMGKSTRNIISMLMTVLKHIKPLKRYSQTTSDEMTLSLWFSVLAYCSENGDYGCGRPSHWQLFWLTIYAMNASAAVLDFSIILADQRLPLLSFENPLLGVSWLFSS